MSKKRLEFETALQRLETVVEEMEQDNLPLDQLLAHFSEGVALVQGCRQQLDEAQKRLDQYSGLPQEKEEEDEV